MQHQSLQSIKAPELYGDHWFNAEPLSIQSSHGKNILLFFWNYTSPGSLRMLTVMKDWHNVYSDLGLICIGVHVPDFSFAMNVKKVEERLKKYSVHFPVVTDNDRRITEAYRISEIPSVVLIGTNGNIYDVVGQHSSLSRLERSIQYLLRQSGFFGELPTLRSIDIDQQSVLHAKEYNTGYFHGSLGNSEGYSPELAAEYQDPGIYVEGKFYAHGIWKAERNAFQYAGGPNEGYLTCLSDGNCIDLLMGSEQKSTIRIMIDETSMPLEFMGTDVKRDTKGNTFVTVTEPQFYSLYRTRLQGIHTVRFIPSSMGTTFYIFSLYNDTTLLDDSELIRNN